MHPYLHPSSSLGNSRIAFRDPHVNSFTAGQCYKLLSLRYVQYYWLRWNSLNFLYTVIMHDIDVKIKRVQHHFAVQQCFSSYSFQIESHNELTAVSAKCLQTFADTVVLLLLGRLFYPNVLPIIMLPYCIRMGRTPYGVQESILYLYLCIYLSFTCTFMYSCHMK